MDAIYLDRLQRLATLLESDAANANGIKFDLGVWGAESNTLADGYTKYLAPKVKDDGSIALDCGTAGCGLGLAAMSGIFKDEGLTFNVENYFGTPNLVPVFNGSFSFGAGAEFFGLSYNESTMLFDPTFYPEDLRKGAPAELEVARRVRQFIIDGTMNYPRV